jgi:hypothetical protein
MEFEKVIISKQTKSVFDCLYFLKLLDSAEDFEKLRVILALRPDKLSPSHEIKLEEKQLEQQQNLQKDK